MRKTASLLALAILLALPAAVSGGDGDAWRTKLSKVDADDVYRAIVEAAQAKDASAALPLLETGLASKFPHIAVACGDALAVIGDAPAKDPEIVKEIVKASKAKDEWRVQNLARVLGAWGVPSLDEHLAALASGRRAPEVQVEALLMCGSVKPTSDADFPKVKKEILDALDGRTDEIRVAASSAAGRLRLAAAAEPLASIVRRDHGEYPGLFAVMALRQIGWTGGISGFLHVLESNPKRETGQACLKAVTDLATRADVPDLLTMSRASKKDHRDAAFVALGRLSWGGGFTGPVVTGTPDKPAVSGVPPEVIDRCIAAVTGDSEWEVRHAARTTLIRIGEPAKEKVRASLPQAIDFGDEDPALLATELCGHFGAKDAYRVLLKATQFEDRSVRRMFAARALEGIDPAKAAADLLAVPEPRAKAKEGELAAVRALGYIRHKDAFDGLVKMLETAGYDEAMKREIEFALERLTAHRFGSLKPDRWRTWFAKSQSPLHTRQHHFDRQANRRAAIQGGLFGLTRETEKCVEDGLRWLELQQHDIGFWDGNEKGFGGSVGCLPAYTGLSTLAYVGAGYTTRAGPEQGGVTAGKDAPAPVNEPLGSKYRETIRRATEFLAATQFYDGGFPVSGGGDSSWIYSYVIAMGIWGICETFSLSGDEVLKWPAQSGIDYLVRVQTPGAGWRYGPRYVQTDTSCTSWTLMTMKTADLAGLDIPQKSFDGIDSWLERCAYDITGEDEVPTDLSNDYDYEVGSRRLFKAFTGYFELSGNEGSALQQTSMTAVGMVCRVFMGWKRSHPFLIGSANYLRDNLPQWMKGLEKGMAIAWYHYYWYYGTLAMYQMGGRYWRDWNEKIKRMYPEKQRRDTPALFGSWDPDTAVLNGGRLFSTAMSILTLETYYRFSPILDEGGEPPPGAAPAPPKGPGGDPPK